MRRLLSVTIFLFFWLVGAEVSGEKPTLEHIFPAGGSPRTTNSLTLFGKFDPWPPSFWSNAEGVMFQTGTNKGKVEVILSEEAKPGAYLIRAYNDEGGSDPKIYVIGKNRQVAETEPNNHFEKVELLKELPTTIDGRLEKKGDVDCFALKVSAGQWIDARVDSHNLMSKLDSVLRLVDESGYELASNHDWSSLDSRLVWRSPVDQKVVLQIFGFLYPANSEIQLSGGDGAIYRLHINRLNDLPADLCEETTEAEPNDSSDKAQGIKCGDKIAAQILSAADEDFYRFEAQKDESFEFRVEAASLGSPLDAWIKVLDATGKELAKDDDSSSRDPRLEWKAPAETNFFLALGSVTHRGGKDYRYHLQIDKLKPDYRVTAAANSLTVAPGSTNDFKLNFKRLLGFTNELSATINSLPDGLKVDPLKLPTKDGEVILKIASETNAPPYNGPFSIVIKDAQTNIERNVPFEFTSRSEDNGVPGGYSTVLVESTDQLWLTVIKPKPAEEKKK